VTAQGGHKGRSKEDGIEGVVNILKNGINTAVYSPIDKEISESLLIIWSTGDKNSWE
jgi:hypothetical protein